MKYKKKTPPRRAGWFLGLKHCSRFENGFIFWVSNRCVRSRRKNGTKRPRYARGIYSVGVWKKFQLFLRAKRTRRTANPGRLSRAVRVRLLRRFWWWLPLLLLTRCAGGTTVSGTARNRYVWRVGTRYTVSALFSPASPTTVSAGRDRGSRSSSATAVRAAAREFAGDRYIPI